MWVFSKEYGLFNLERYDRVKSDGQYTYAYKEGGTSRPISHTDIVGAICDAIRNDVKYMEVE